MSTEGTEKRMPNIKKKLTYQSAAIVGGHQRPRIELPALSLEAPRAPAAAVDGVVSVQIVAGSDEALREPHLGLLDLQRVSLVLSHEEYARLRERVRGIRQNPLKLELELDEHGQIISAK